MPKLPPETRIPNKNSIFQKESIFRSKSTKQKLRIKRSFGNTKHSILRYFSEEKETFLDESTPEVVEISSTFDEDLTREFTGVLTEDGPIFPSEKDIPLDEFLTDTGEFVIAVDAILDSPEEDLTEPDSSTIPKEEI